GAVRGQDPGGHRLSAMGWGALHRGRLAEAERAFRRTLALAEKSGNPHWVATSLAVLANALAQSDRLAEAFDLFTEARAIHPASRAENFIISDVETVARWFAGDFPGALAIAEEMVARNRTGLRRRQLACS